MSLRVLLLAGTAEAREIAAGLATMPGVTAIASLSGATRSPAAFPVPVRSGGFGGVDGFVRYLKAERIGAVIDASHPFAARISVRTAAVCGAHGLRYLSVQRPAWLAQAGDDWHPIAREDEAADLIPIGARVFLATGPARLDHFAGLSGRVLICRRIDPPPVPFPFPGGMYVQGRPPFSTEQELETFRKFRVDWLVTRNSGGVAGRNKLEAARLLGLPVAMIDRPPTPQDVPRVTTAIAALEWTERHAWTNASS